MKPSVKKTPSTTASPSLGAQANAQTGANGAQPNMSVTLGVGSSGLGAQNDLIADSVKDIEMGGIGDVVTPSVVKGEKQTSDGQIVEEVEVNGDIPQARFGHTITIVSKTKVVLFGGATGDTGKYSMTGETYMYNILNKAW